MIKKIGHFFLGLVGEFMYLQQRRIEMTRRWLGM